MNVTRNGFDHYIFGPVAVAYFLGFLLRRKVTGQHEIPTLHDIEHPPLPGFSLRLFGRKKAS